MQPVTAGCNLFVDRCKSFTSWSPIFRWNSFLLTLGNTFTRWFASSTSRRKYWSTFRLLLTCHMLGKLSTGFSISFSHCHLCFPYFIDHNFPKNMKSVTYSIIWLIVILFGKKTRGYLALFLSPKLLNILWT